MAAPVPVAGDYLEAIAAEELPLRIPAPTQATGAFVEIRTYSAPPELTGLRNAGIDFALLDSHTLLANFESLEARDQAWTRFLAFRKNSGEVTSLSVFRNRKLIDSD